LPDLFEHVMTTKTLQVLDKQITAVSSDLSDPNIILVTYP
jgi:hypothetical protein